MASQPDRLARARSHEEKLARRDDILRAAERLWTTSAYADLSMNEVAREVQLAKGTLYLYFATKEELFLALLTEHYQAWFAALGKLLSERRPQQPDEVADTIFESLRGFEAKRRLQLLLGNVLERSEQALTFRKSLVDLMREAASKLPYPAETGLRILIHTDALCVGWQHLAEESPTHRTLLLHPELRPLSVTFDEEILASLRALLHYLAAEPGGA